MIVWIEEGIELNRIILLIIFSQLYRCYGKLQLVKGGVLLCIILRILWGLIKCQ